MEKRREIQIEMEEISPAVAAITNTNVYTVDENYFKGFASRLKMHPEITEFDNSLLAQPPAGYFEGLAGNILLRIKKENTAVIKSETEQELLEVAPALAGISKANVYSLPENYFENFVVNTGVQEPAKVIPFTFKKWAGYAAAAVTAGIIVIAAFFFKGSNASQDYPGYSSLNINKTVSQISDTEINNYLDKTSENGDIALTAGFEVQPNEDTDVEDFINSAPDKDIEEYLNTNAEPGEKPVKGI